MIALIGSSTEAEKFAEFFKLNKGTYKAVYSLKMVVGFFFESYTETYAYQDYVSAKLYSDIIAYLEAQGCKRTYEFENE